MTFYLPVSYSDTNDIWWHYCSLFKCFNIKQARLNYQPEYQLCISNDGILSSTVDYFLLVCVTMFLCGSSRMCINSPSKLMWLKVREILESTLTVTHLTPPATHPVLRPHADRQPDWIGVPSSPRVALWWHHLWLKLSQSSSRWCLRRDTSVNKRWKLCVCVWGSHNEPVYTDFKWHPVFRQTM